MTIQNEESKHTFMVCLKHISPIKKYLLITSTFRVELKNVVIG